MNKLLWIVITLICCFNVTTQGKFRNNLLVKGNICDFRTLNDSVTIAFPIKNRLYLTNIITKIVTDTLDFGLQGSVTCMDYCPKTGFLALGTQQGEVVVTDLKGNFKQLKKTQSQIIAIKLSNAGLSLATTSTDGLLQLWALPETTLKWSRKGHDDHILSICFGLNDRLIYTGSADKRIAIWDAEEGKVTDYLNDVNSWISALTISPKDSSLMAASYNGFVTSWKITNLALEYVKKEKVSSSWLLSLLAEDDFWVFGDQNGKVRLKTKFGIYRMYFNKPVTRIESRIINDQIVLTILRLHKGIYTMCISDDKVDFGSN